MLKWLGDNWFGIVGIGIGLVGGWLIALWQRQPSTIDYIVSPAVPLINDAAPVKGRLKIMFDDEERADPRIQIIRIINTGKKAVKRDDFVQSILVTWPKNPPLDIDVFQATSQDLLDQIFPAGDFGHDGAFGSAFEPDLMNPGDSFSLLVIGDGEIGIPVVTCRYADQARPMQQIGEDRFGEALAQALGATAVAVVVPGMRGLSMGLRLKK